MKQESFFVREVMSVTEWEQLTSADQERSIDIIRNTAARVLAQSILFGASVYTVRQLPEAFSFGGAMIEHQWKVTVVMPENGTTDHLDQIIAAKIEGRRDGLHVAAHQLEMTAGSGLYSDYATTILRRQAQALRRLADRAEPSAEKVRPASDASGGD